MKQRPDPHEHDQNMHPLFRELLKQVAEGPKARLTDPETSHEAAQALKGKPRIGELQSIALRIVRGHPGATAAEIWEMSGIRDARTITPRLAPLRRAGLIKNMPLDHPERRRVDPVSGKQQLTWWPV